ncbi:MAG TPA: ZIP family metal transporter [Steroidobacteraceae bacterium]|nr:ZIP family metal transporter [Steroidobacteraceae bacterium]
MHTLIVLSLAAATCVATLFGGLLGIAQRGRLHLMLGFSAGAVIGVALFDLLPEAVELEGDPRRIIAVAGLCLLLYMLMDRSLALHPHGRSDQRRGWLGAGSLVIHSFLDGFAIGVGFQAGRAVGIAVAVAVLAHDFADGLNTVGIVFRNGGRRDGALGWLIADALAPVVGAAASLFLAWPQHRIALLLALFAGVFLYLGAADLLPESHHGDPRLRTTLATLLGAATLYIVARVAG